MPIYEYRCQGCGSEWEEVQKITESPVEVCPECGEPQAHRLISRTNFVLRGAGWYVSDYGRGSGGRAGEKKSSETKSSEKKDSTKDSASSTPPSTTSSKKDD